MKKGKEQALSPDFQGFVTKRQTLYCIRLPPQIPHASNPDLLRRPPQHALSEAGADAEQFIVRNLTSADVADSVERFAAAVRTAQMIVIPGGFSGGDEPDGSAKLITAFFRNAAVREQVTALLEQRDGLMLGICNGFQALIKLGLVPYGRIMDTDESFPTLTYNVIGRHQSKLVRTRVC